MPKKYVSSPPTGKRPGPTTTNRRREAANRRDRLRRKIATRKRAAEAAAVAAAATAVATQRRKVKIGKRVSSTLASLTNGSRDGLCEHPRSRAPGMCAQLARTVEVVPDDYTIPGALRFAERLDVTRPSARLCPQHAFLVRAHRERAEALAAGATKEELAALSPRDYAHRSRCTVCLHPDPGAVELAVRWWTQYGMTATEAALELGVPLSAFNNHVNYFGYDEKRAERKHTRKALARIVDAGLQGGKATIKDALAALGQLQKDRGDAIKVDVRAQVATIDLTSMTNAQIAAHYKQQLAEVERLEQLPDLDGGGEMSMGQELASDIDDADGFEEP